MKIRFISAALTFAALATVAFFWLTDVPLGIPGEWTWLRIPIEPERRLEFVWGVVLATLGAVLYIVLAWLGARRLPHARRGEVGAWLAALAFGGFAWLFFAQESPVDGYRMSKSAFVLYYESSSGYFTIARDRMDDVPSFLARYERVIDGEVFHIGTHPPGLILAHRGLINLCREFPVLTQMLVVSQPESVHAAFADINSHAAAAVPGRAKLLESDRAALWLAALLTQLVTAATVIPLYLLAVRQVPRPAAWKAAAFWPLVPALAVFLPKSDALYPFLGMLFLWLWLEGRGRRSLVMCASAGLVLWVGMFCSLALAPVAGLGVILTAWEVWAESGRFPRRAAWRQLAILAGCTTAAFLLPSIVLWFAFDLNLLHVWTENYRNHAAFYSVMQRTWWKWLLVNPVEAALAVGLPAVVLAVAACGRVLGSEQRTSPSAGPYWGCLAVAALLWISGKNSGEAARLWLVLFPWPLWLAAELFSERHDPDSARHPFRFWLWALALQAAACIATVTRVYGFLQ